MRQTRTVLQYASDPFEGNWENLASVSCTGAGCIVNPIKNLPVNETLRRWCAEGVMRLLGEGDDVHGEFVAPGTDEFFKIVVERVGKLKYRFVEEEEI